MLSYKIKEPIQILDKNPVLILIHGYGSNEEDLFSFASELPSNYYILSIRAPYDLAFGGYAWYAINFDANENKFSNINEAKKSCELVLNFINEILKKYPINSQKVSLIGFSQGAILSYAIGVSNPDKIHRIVAMSGYFNLEMAHENFTTNNFNNLKIFASHGSVDQVVPVEWARKAKPILDSLKIENIYKEYPVGHGIAPQNFIDFKNWLIETENS